jgi:hypothetical protein
MPDAGERPSRAALARRLDGLIAYLTIPWRPRAAFSYLQRFPTWGWAALLGMLLTALAALIAQPAQLHVLAVSEAHRIAALPPGAQLRERMAVAQTSRSIGLLLMIGALVGPWLVWALIAIFFFISAAIGGGKARFAAAWVAALNSYAVLGIALVVNALLVSLHDPSSLNSSLDLARLPNLGMFFQHDRILAAFLSAYNPLYIWYYVIVAIALERLLGMPRPAAAVAAVAYSLLQGVIAAVS